MNDDGFLPGIVIGVIVMLALGAFVLTSSDNSWRERIAKHGCAHYYLDSNNVRQWDWIKP